MTQNLTGTQHVTGTQHFTGTLTAADHKGHIPVPFTVRPGTARISAHFTATPHRATGALYDNMICLSLFGPGGGRGARHNNPVWDFWAEADHAAPGYLPGPLTAGTLSVVINIFRMLGPGPGALDA